MEIKNLVKRVSGTGDFITYDPAKCVSCGACSLICPMNLWGTKAGKAFLVPDYQDKCLECGSCWLVCQSNAIDFSYPKAGTGVIWEYG